MGLGRRMQGFAAHIEMTNKLMARQQREKALLATVAAEHRGTHIEQTTEGVRVVCDCGVATVLDHRATEDEVNAAVDDHLRSLWTRAGL